MGAGEKILPTIGVGAVFGLIGGIISGIFIADISFWLGFFRWFGIGAFSTLSVFFLLDESYLIGVCGILGAIVGGIIGNAVGIGAVYGILIGFVSPLLLAILLLILTFVVPPLGKLPGLLRGKAKVKAQKKRDAEQAKLDRTEEMQAVRDKIGSLAEKATHIHSSIDSLETMEKDAKVSNMIEQLNKFLAGIYKYHDSYCAVLIRLEFQKMVNNISAKDVSQLDMKRIFKDIDAAVKKIEKLYEELRATVKKEKADSNEKTGFLDEYNDKIRDLKLKMVSLQTTKIMSDASPINEVMALLHQFDDDPQSGGAIANLNDEYDKFIAEMEVSNL